MRRVVLRGLLGRKVRSLLTGAAIVLGVAMVSGTFVLTDTIEGAFGSLIEDAYAETDALVSGEEVVDGATAGPASVPASLLGRVRALPQVEAAAGTIEDSAKLVRADGTTVSTGGAPTLGLSTDPGAQRFNPLTLTDGRWPRRGDEVVLDRGTAEREGIAPGDTVRVATRKPVQAFTVTGLAGFGDVSSLGGATIAVFHTETAQRLFDKESRFDAISVAAARGVSTSALLAAIEPLLPETARVESADERAGAEIEETSEALAFMRSFLLAFGGVALFVGAFVIFNALSITVAQRTRELATLRTLGASRRQVLAAVLLEALVIGAAASAAGLAAGVALAKGLSQVLAEAGIELPRADTVVASRTVVLSLAVGVVVTVAAALAPALRATRVPPLAAVREGAVLPGGRLARVAPAAALAVSGLAAAALGWGLFADGLATTERLLALAGGCLLLFVGVALVSARLIGPLARALAPVAEALMLALGAALWLVSLPLVLVAWLVSAGLARLGRVEEPTPLLPSLAPDRALRRLAGENARRAPGRTAATSAALMIGLALVTFVAVLGEGLRTSVRAMVDDQVRAEYVVSGQDGFGAFPAAAERRLARLDLVERWTGVREELAVLDDGEETYVAGIDPRTIGTFYRFRWEHGDAGTPAALGARGTIVSSELAERRGLGPGDALTVRTPDGTRLRLVVQGIYSPPALGSLLADVVITQMAWDRAFPQRLDLNVYVDVRGEPSPQAERELAAALAAFPDVKVQTQAAFVAAQQRIVDTLLNLLYVLLALSLLVGVLGMVNTMALSVFERTRELGMLRAIGMTRRQARRLVRHESVITSLLGVALGLPLGVVLAALVVRALADLGMVFSLPLTSLGVFTAVAAAAGLLAAILPARRAARLPVLDALGYE